MKQFKTSILFFFIFIFTSCSYPNLTYNYELTTTNYNEIIGKLLNKASKRIAAKVHQDEILLVSNFADTMSLKSDTRLSFVLSDTLKDMIVEKYNYGVKEIELSKQFQFGKEGFKALSRDINKINRKLINPRFIVVGTYTITKNQLLLFLKLINIEDGTILASSSHREDLTQEIVNLHNDAFKKPRQDIYQPMVL